MTFTRHIATADGYALSPCGRGHLRSVRPEHRLGEGYRHHMSMLETTPHPPPLRDATLSHKARGEESRQLHAVNHT